MRLTAGLLRRGSRWNRLRKARRVLALMAESRPKSVLLVGLGREGLAEANLVERSVATAAPWAVLCGLHEDPVRAGELAGRPYVRCDGRALPFKRGAFDMVVSNAVIEHVGGFTEQKGFAAEHARVGRSLVITTPNRWFPIESHTRAIFWHWSERWRAEEIATGRSTFTRLLSRDEFRAVLPNRAEIFGTALSPTLMAVARSHENAEPEETVA